MINLLFHLLAFPPTVPTGTPSDIIQNALTFFETWISRGGGLVAFAGAIKFALAVRTEDEKELMNAVLVMVSGFMICEAIDNLKLFKLPAAYSAAAANTSFKALTKFIGKWGARVGSVGLFAGAIQFGFGIKENNATSKVIALKGMTAGAMVIGISGILHLFV